MFRDLKGTTTRFCVKTGLSKLSTYCQFKFLLELQSYNAENLQKKYKIALAKFRCTNHKLSIERFRGT